MQKNSGRAKILEVLGRYPDGLNSTKICEMVLKEYAMERHYLISEIARIAKEGKLTKVKRKECPSCGFHSVVYSLKKPS